MSCIRNDRDFIVALSRNSLRRMEKYLSQDRWFCRRKMTSLSVDTNFLPISEAEGDLRERTGVFSSLTDRSCFTILCVSRLKT
jgi:hypothetical protein